LLAVPGGRSTGPTRIQGELEGLMATNGEGGNCGAAGSCLSSSLSQGAKGGQIRVTASIRASQSLSRPGPGLSITGSRSRWLSRSSIPTLNGLPSKSLAQRWIIINRPCSSSFAEHHLFLQNLCGGFPLSLEVEAETVMDTAAYEFASVLSFLLESVFPLPTVPSVKASGSL